MIRKNILLFLILLVVGGNIGAIIMAQEEKKGPTPPEKKWSLSLSGGMTFNSGNTQSLLFNGAVGFRWGFGHFLYSTSLDVYYGSTEGTEIANKGKWLNGLSLELSKRTNLYWKLSMEYDKFSDIALQTITGIGFQYDITESEKTKSTLTITTDIELTDIYIIFQNLEAILLNLSYSLERKPSKSLRFSIYTSINSNLGHFFDDYQIELKADAAINIISTLWIKVKLQDKYTNLPLDPRIKKNDLVVVTAFEVTF